MSTSASDIAVQLCKEFEGFSPVPYICPAGYPTIGYGTVFKPDGTKVSMSDPRIDEKTASEWLLSEIGHNYMAGVLRASPNLANYPERLGAITSFAYNLGVGRYRASTLRRRVDEENWEEAKSELMKWVRGGGRVLPGLVRRRLAEASFM